MKNAFTKAQYAEAHAMNDTRDFETADTAVLTQDMVEPNPFDGAPLLDPETNIVITDTDIATDEDRAAFIAEVAEITTDEDEVIDPLLEEVVGEEILIEALEEASAQVEAPVLDIEASEEHQASTPFTSQDFDARLAAVTDEDAINMAVKIGFAIDERADFERAKGNETIQKHLAKSRKQLATPRAARVAIVCNVDIAEINRSVHEGSRYNVYALGKLADAIQALSGGVIGNAINNACMRSLFRFRAADMVFNGEMAKAAASDKIRVEIGLRGVLVRHTVSASTASTQASSTMQALTTLGIVSRSGSQKNPIFTLTDTDIVAKLSDVVAKAA